MAFLGDYHTHTVYSRHGKKLHAVGTVLENARIASERGLRELAITDHANLHYYGVSAGDVDRLKSEAAQAEKEYGIKIYVGLEHNLDYRSGKVGELVPLPEYEANKDEIQIVQGGYHAMMGTPKLIFNLLFWARNVIFKFLPGRKKLIERNTKAYKRMIDEYPIDFIGHLNRGIMADAVEVAKYAHSKGVYIELNGRHKSLGKKEIKQMVSAGVEFICNSDAHKPSSVGSFPKAERMIQKYGIPTELIANWDRLPSFRSRAGGGDDA